MTGVNRVKAWEITLILLSLLYLIFELAFNSRIVDGSVGAFDAFDAVQLEAMELFLHPAGPDF